MNGISTLIKKKKERKPHHCFHCVRKQQNVPGMNQEVGRHQDASTLAP